MCLLFFFSLSGFSPSKMFSPRDEREEESCAPRGRKSLRERERERSSSRDGRRGEKKPSVVSLLRCVSVVSSSEEEEEEEKERERERCKIFPSICWKKIDLSLSLFLIFAPSFLPCFFLFLCLLSLFYVVGKRERVLLGVDCFDLRTKER